MLADSVFDEFWAWQGISRHKRKKLLPDQLGGKKHK